MNYFDILEHGEEGNIVNFKKDKLTIRQMQYHKEYDIVF